MGIWALANQETVREIANIYGVSRGTAHTCIFEILTAIALHLKPIYIKWPNSSECQKISSSFEQQHGIEDIIGCIDGTHIPVRPPAHDRDSYINRKGFASVNAMAVCDNDKKFTFVYADHAGSVHDARVLRVSPLAHKLETGFLKSTGGEQYILLGDSAYPLLPNLIVPYRDNGHLSQRQQKFNYVHSSARSVIERAFGRLKGTFRRLRGIDCTYPVNALKVIEAAFTLHNFILQHDYDDGDDDVTYADMPVVELSLSEDASEFTNAAARKAAKDRRDQIAQKL